MYCLTLHISNGIIFNTKYLGECFMINILFCDDNTGSSLYCSAMSETLFKTITEISLRMRNFTAMITAAKSFLLPKEIVLMLSFLT